MITPDAHRASASSFISDIEEKMKADIVVERQRLIGFACSEASCDLLALMLHAKKTHSTRL